MKKNLLWQHFSKDILALFRHVLVYTYFSVGGRFYEPIDGVVMGSRPSAVIANFFMEDFEEKTLAHLTYKPVCWFRFVNDSLSSGSTEQKI